MEISEVESFAPGSDIVGIILQFDSPDLLQRCAVIQSTRAVLVVGDGEPVGFRGEADSLRHAEVPDVLRDLARRQIDHLHSAVSESRDKEPFSLRVQSKVIDATLDAVQRNCLDLSQQVGALARALRVRVTTATTIRNNCRINLLEGIDGI